MRLFPAASRRGPALSVVIVVYNIPREAPRTLLSLSAQYQQHIDPDDYEIIVVDNGSNPPLDRKVFKGLKGNFRLLRVDNAPPSPARAINLGLEEARGEIVGVMIDGARIVTPGLLHFARAGMQIYPRAVVATLGWYLGFDLQQYSIEAHYDQKREDAMLASIEWPKDGYRLFEIGAIDESSVDGWFGRITESNCLFLSRASWRKLGGVDERFDVPGGGFLNLDTFVRALELPDSELVILLGEATFHQLHGGIATNANFRGFPDVVKKWEAQYKAIRGRPWQQPMSARSFIGTLPQSALVHFTRSIIDPINEYQSPFDAPFDKSLWSMTPSPHPSDPTIAALNDLACEEFRSGRMEAAATIARMTRSRAPDEPAPQRLLPIASRWLCRHAEPEDPHGRALFHLAVGKAHELIGDKDAAAAEYRTALSHQSDLPAAQLNLTGLQFPGENYLEWLVRLHAVLQPKTYLEIGVGEGRALAYAHPPTQAIGVDPEPKISVTFKTETQIFCETSDEFFLKNRLELLLGVKPLDLVFIDGMHLFENALRDFINSEAHGHRKTVIVLHDTIPFDEPTQRRKRQMNFYTGDVWKTVLCLKHYRPDLVIFTVATMPTGLTFVVNLDPASRVLTEKYDEAIKRFMAMPFSAIEKDLDPALNIVPNDWSAVAARLNTLDILPRSEKSSAGENLTDLVNR
jgi:glycosyltransferase involved in cell wall biosynthesis/predicted O-methyltransferase YrrM